MKAYKIDITDIKGVGPKTAETIDQALDGDGVRALHLFATPGGSAWRRLEDAGIGQDVMERLMEIGQAVEGTGPAYVKAMHLTGDLADEAVLRTSTVRIDEPRESSEPEPETNGDVPDHGEADVGDALESIRSEYGDGYPEWGRFLVDFARFVEDESNRDLDLNEPDHAMPVVRYQQTSADVLLRDDDWTDAHIDALVRFAETV